MILIYLVGVCLRNEARGHAPTGARGVIISILFDT